MSNSEHNQPPLPQNVVDFVESIVKMSSRRKRTRDEVRRELLGHFEDCLENTKEEERLEKSRSMLHEFGQSAVLGRLIYRGKQRCRPTWEKVLWGLAYALIVLTIAVPAIAWIAGLHAENVYQREIAKLREEGALRDVSQLQSIRPSTTVFFSGRDEDCATSMLLAFERDESLLESTAQYVDWLPDVDGEKEQVLKDLVAGHKGELEQLRRVAGMPPTSMAQVLRVGKPVRPYEILRHPSGIMAYMQLMLIHAFLMHRAGDDNGALAECSCLLSLAGHMRDIPMGICALTSLSMEIKMARVLAPLSFSESLSPDVIRAFAREWDPNEDRMAFAQSIEFQTGSLWTLIHDPVFSKGLLPPNSSLGERLLARMYLTPFMRVFSGPFETKSATEYRDYAIYARKPFYEVREKVEAFETQARQQGVNMYSRELPPATYLTNCLSENAFAETRLSQAKIAFALNLYKRKTGSYPEHLHNLVPDVLTTIPVDPYSGKQMSYLVWNSNYLLYSTGLNGQDDTASAYNSRNMAKLVVGSDDIAWGILQTYESPPLPQVGPLECKR